MQASEQQSAEDAVSDPSTASGDAAPELIKLFGYLADADSDDEVQLRQSPAGESGRWIVLRRADIVSQQPDPHDSLRNPGRTLVLVSSHTTVVFRAAFAASRLEAVVAATRGTDIGEAKELPDPDDDLRWPRRRP